MFSAGMLLRVHLEEKERKKVNMIWLSAQKLHSLTNDLLLMAKMESGKIILNQVESDLGDIAQQVVADLTDLAKQKNIRLIGSLPEEHKNILLDANLFVRIIDNLISNAIKFSPSDSQIAVSVEYFNDSEIQARIRVIDEGQGIRPEVREYIFAKYEVGNIISGVSQTGLGLAFCKMAVEAHGGRIFIEDNQPTGSVFTIEILKTQ
jgi:signal transduction histidine kinase